MSLVKISELVFSCPHTDCIFKLKKYESVKDLNMHWSKKHSSISKLQLDSSGRVFLRTK